AFDLPSKALVAPAVLLELRCQFSSCSSFPEAQASEFCPLRSTQFTHFDREMTMTSTDSETAFVQPVRIVRPPEAAKTPPAADWWARVQERLRTEVGDDVYSSWFARMELDGSEGETLKLSVPTRFLKSWIQSHYTEKVLAC